MNMQIYEEATEWIILHRSDSLDADLRRRFDAWLRESPQHLRAYIEMSNIWEDVPALHPEWNASAAELIARARAEGNVFPLDGSQFAAPKEVEPIEAFKALNVVDLQTDAAYSNAPALQSVPSITAPASRRSSFGHYAIAIAATVIIFVGAGWFYLQRGIYTTDTGEQRTIALTDGSTVELNAQTRIRIAYTDDRRTIQLLRGQALFRVVEDPERPFVVESDAIRVRAVGTQFDVYKKSAGTQVTVVEGRVAVATPGQVQTASGNTPTISERPAASASSPRATEHVAHTLQAHFGEVLLSAGEQILIAQATPARELGFRSAAEPVGPASDTEVSGAAAAIKPANIEASTAWTQQRLVFDFTPLTEVAQEFNRHNRRPLVIEDPSLVNFNISGSFSSTDPTLLLRFLREQPGIVVNESDSEIRISRQEV